MISYENHSSILHDILYTPGQELLNCSTLIQGLKTQRKILFSWVPKGVKKTIGIPILCSIIWAYKMMKIWMVHDSQLVVENRIILNKFKLSYISGFPNSFMHNKLSLFSGRLKVQGHVFCQKMILKRINTIHLIILNKAISPDVNAAHYNRSEYATIADTQGYKD